MKRLITAIILLSVCAATSLYFSNNLKNELLSARKTVIKIKEFCVQNQQENAFDESGKLLGKWKNHTLLNTTALKRESTEEIERSINEIYVLISDGNLEKATEVCETTVAQIDYLLHAEQLDFENVF